MALVTEESANQIESEKLNEMLVFSERGKSQNPEEKTLRAEKRTTKLNPHMTKSQRKRKNKKRKLIARTTEERVDCTKHTGHSISFRLALHE